LFLSRPDVLVYLRSKRLRFEPEISEDRVAQVSIDRLLGRRFTKFKDKPGYLPSIQMDPSLWESIDVWEDSLETDLFCLYPGQFVLAQTLERVYIPNDLLGFVQQFSV
jgi:deoxycytidine triphosphate deaminase